QKSSPNMEFSKKDLEAIQAKMDMQARPVNLELAKQGLGEKSMMQLMEAAKATVTDPASNHLAAQLRTAIGKAQGHGKSLEDTLLDGQQVILDHQQRMLDQKSHL